MNAKFARESYTLVVGIDYSELSELVVREAVSLASSREQSHIHLLHAAPIADAAATLVTRPSPQTVSGGASLFLEMSNDMRRYVELVLAGLGQERALDRIRWSIHLRHSEPAQALAQLASDTEADLVLVGTHGRRGLARFLVGSVAEAVVRLAPCPVLVVRPRGATAGGEEVKIEPPCSECLAARRVSQGEVFWCERHSQHHERAHTYHFTPFRDSHQSGLLLHPLD